MIYVSFLVQLAFSRFGILPGLEMKNKPKDGEIISDPRFARVHYDPRFKQISKKSSKIKIDSRFSAVLKSGHFLEGTSEVGIDKYGRPQKPCSSKEKLERYYSQDFPDDESSVDYDAFRDGDGYDGARGIGVETSSEEESEDSCDVGEDLFQYGPYSECGTLPAEHLSDRLALVDIDWDNTDAAAIYKILNTFVPSGGRLNSVKIYASEFGKKRLKEEDLNGPPEDIFLPNSDESPGKTRNPPERLFEEQDAEAFDQIKLRKYLLERLKYYYCVVEFDSAETARVVYRECNGLEVEHSSNIIDLRYIPDDMLFGDEPVGYANESSASSFEGLNFVTDSLQLSRPKLAWDEDEHNVRIIKRRFTDDEIERMDLKTYMASPSSSDHSDDGGATRGGGKLLKRNKIRERYLRLITGGTGDGSVYQRSRDNDIDVTFKPAIDLEAPGRGGPEFEDQSCGGEASDGSDQDRGAVSSDDDSPGGFHGDAGNTPDTTGHSDTEKRDQQDNKSGLRERAGIAFGDSIHPSKAVPGRRKKLSAEERKAIKKQRDDLELLIMDDSNLAGSGGCEHFSAKQIIKHEKMLAARGKVKNKRKKNIDTSKIQPSFRLDAQDERFANFYKDQDFAIDPTCPQYKPTKSTTFLLSERRKVSARRNPAIPLEGRPTASRHEGTLSTEPAGISTSKLVESLKGKAKTTGKVRKRAPLDEISEKFNLEKRKTLFT